MAETRVVTGNRDDVRIDSSRCLRMRFSESSCRLCTATCPHGAVTLKGGLSIQSAHCRGCLLCTAVCPAGALEHNSDFAACLVQLSRVPQPILGCVRTQGCSNATVSCLAGLSAEHLLALCHTLPDQLTLNLSSCGDCPNNTALPRLHHDLTFLSESGLLDGGCRIIIADTAPELVYRAEALDRRSFFTSIRNSLFQSAAVMLSGSTQQPGKRNGYGEKRVPARRELLNRTRSRLSPEREARIRQHFDAYVSCDDSCTQCHGCVAICPTGALRSELPGTPPAFDRLLCTGCGLCREFCLDGAVRISTGSGEEGSE